MGGFWDDVTVKSQNGAYGSYLIPPTMKQSHAHLEDGWPRFCRIKSQIFMVRSSKYDLNPSRQTMFGLHLISK